MGASAGALLPAAKGTQMQRIPTLVGVSGHFEGEVYPLEYGKTLCVGRSRSADFSLRRTSKYRAMDENTRETDASAKTVSGKHFEITMYNVGSIEIKNLSPNGLHVDGKLTNLVVIDDIAKRTHEIRFGADEILRLEMRVHEDL